MRMLRHSLLALACLTTVALAQDTKLLCGFEDNSALRMWQFTSGSGRIVAEGVTEGKKAMELTFDPKGKYLAGYLYWNRPPRDWSAYDALQLDVTNPADHPIRGSVLIADQAWVDGNRSYWNRHNGGTTFAPGRTTWTIPVRGLYRGEAGSRNNDIKRNIDPDKIVRVDLAWGKAGSTGRVLIDNLRFVKTGRPAGVWAFDFGPPSQSLMLGWTAMAHDTAYSKQRGYGWGPRGGHPWNGAARDTTFGTMLLQDFCEARGYNFHVDVPPGRYAIAVLYENCGYWGGEQARHTWRTIAVNGKQAWREDRPDGQAHALYRFENVEPIGVDIWDTYMKAELAKPVVFEADADADGLTLRCDADRPWGSKLAAVAIHKADDAAAAKWLASQLDALATEFRSKAVCLDKPAPEPAHADAWKQLGFVAWPVRIEDTVTPDSVPPPGAKGPAEVSIARTAVGGEAELFCLAIRPLRDFSCALDASFAPWATSLGLEVDMAWYNTSRGFGQIAYRVRPHTLRRLHRKQAIQFRKGVTRLLVLKVTVQVPMPASHHKGKLRLLDPQGTELWGLPLQLDLRPVALDRQTDYLMGFFGLMPSGLVPDETRWDVLDTTLALLRQYGMNAVSGGPSWSLKGWKNGQPVIDFGETDRFFDLLKKRGFTKAINGYGGLRFRGLHRGYQKGADGAKAEQQSGLPFAEAMMRAWKAVDAHARQRGWPTIFYAMCDETRVRDVAERQLAFMKIMDKVTDAFPKTVQASGSYSVHFNARPTDKDNLLYWHQRFFEALDINSLNLHDAGVMAEAKKLGRSVHIYNQGRSRYSFGLYQWSEWRKGVAARWQWHLNVLHGYQFFDLDGREPDTAMICYGRDRIHPTIHFERCREGAEDFYLTNTLARRIDQMRKDSKDTQAVRDAARLLDGIAARVKLNQRNPPEGFDADALKLQVIAAIESLGK